MHITLWEWNDHATVLEGLEYGEAELAAFPERVIVVRGCKPASEAPADAGNQYSLRAQLQFGF